MAAPKTQEEKTGRDVNGELLYEKMHASSLRIFIIYGDWGNVSLSLLAARNSG